MVYSLQRSQVGSAMSHTCALALRIFIKRTALTMSLQLLVDGFSGPVSPSPLLVKSDNTSDCAYCHHFVSKPGTCNF